MAYIADLHLHSKYSRATSSRAGLEEYAAEAALKGIKVIGTGDLTHPAWISEIKTKLENCGNGLYKLSKYFLPAGNMGAHVRFCLSTEISSIFKKNGITRKVHTLVYVPRIEDAEIIGKRLSAIGNIASDGRPILGLEPKHLLEIVLETNPDAAVVPAHIWTPWFGLFGSKTGFNSVEECFEDMTQYLFALETGLSSDPPMNWKISNIDRYMLMSNSDAHSPETLGREANVFEGEVSYEHMFNSLRTGDGFYGTLEMYPEEGKYHADGHRKCGVVLNPEETMRCNGLCPECGKPLTLGVLHRVEQLADKEQTKNPHTGISFESVVPLKRILSRLLSKGDKTKTVEKAYNNIISRIGSEFAVLREAPIEDIRNKGGTELSEAVRNMRAGKVDIKPGYDGQFGEVRF